MKYHKCKKYELVAFAAARGLQVTAQAPARGPYRRDYIAALEQADREATFRFLDLPPELRNWVYEDLLVLKNNFKCHHQILRTCRQIQAEATNILYGDNLIEIKVKAEGVYVHGELCGNYRPSAPPGASDYRNITWPTFLQKAQLLRLSLPLVEPSRRRQPIVEHLRLPALSNVIWSLAAFLSENNSLRSFEVDLALVKHYAQSSYNWEHEIETACYPLRLLGINSCTITESTIPGLGSIDVIGMASLNTHDLSLTEKFRLLKETLEILSALTGPGGMLQPMIMLIHFLGALVGAVSACANRSYSTPFWIKASTGVIMWLRVLNEGDHFHNAAVVDQAAYYRLHELLRLEVDLRVGRATQE